MRLNFPSFAVFESAVNALRVGKVGHEILERRSESLLLALAWGQKPQFAKHFPNL